MKHTKEHMMVDLNLQLSGVISWIKDIDCVMNLVGGGGGEKN